MITPEDIQTIKDAIDIGALVSESVSLTPHGRSRVGRCPFCLGKPGSFHVNAESGHFHCFDCKEGGSAIDFVMKRDAKTYAESVRFLFERAMVAVVSRAQAKRGLA